MKLARVVKINSSYKMYGHGFRYAVKWNTGNYYSSFSTNKNCIEFNQYKSFCFNMFGEPWQILKKQEIKEQAKWAFIYGTGSRYPRSSIYFKDEKHLLLLRMM